MVDEYVLCILGKPYPYVFFCILSCFVCCVYFEFASLLFCVAFLVTAKVLF